MLFQKLWQYSDSTCAKALKLGKCYEMERARSERNLEFPQIAIEK